MPRDFYELNTIFRKPVLGFEEQFARRPGPLLFLLKKPVGRQPVEIVGVELQAAE